MSVLSGGGGTRYELHGRRGTTNGTFGRHENISKTAKTTDDDNNDAIKLMQISTCARERIKF